ncbi:MFS transporter [Saccharophagus degradans]|uniref:MFS transporter n=1 Tax=Saccharophagus degradans TaxID=86304 RepID=UPI002477FD80|nr:MFS transporter [Saccharophagus degradans]WGO97533.1 MFS transporter [Saccharophagus degradans]
MATASMQKLSVMEKSGYAMGDMAANLVWRGVLGYLALFYTDTLGISATAAALLLLSVRISDGITDIGMGMIADRTNTKHGKFRPWILGSAPVLALFMVLSFTAPDVGPGLKLAWAYFTYIALTLAYTVNNVPYSALMGVMTPSHTERSVLSGYRFAGAFGGGLLVMGFTPRLIEFFGQGDDVAGYKATFSMFAVLLVALCAVTFFTTKERVIPKPEEATSGGTDTIVTLLVFVFGLLGIVLFCVLQTLPQSHEYALTTTGRIITTLLCLFSTFICVVYFKRLISKPSTERSKASNDLVDLICNVPWLLVLALGFLTMLFNGIKYSVVAYYFTHFMHDKSLAGDFFIVLLAVSMVAALSAGYFIRLIGKKMLFAISLTMGGIFSCAMFIPDEGEVTLIFVLGGIAEFFAAMMPVLVFSMLGDSADYSEWKNGRRATGLAYAAGSFIQKTGGGFAGAMVLLVLAFYGYVGTDESTIAQATVGMRHLISWVPAIFAFLGLFVLIFYPLNTKRMSEIEADLTARRG